VADTRATRRTGGKPAPNSDPPGDPLTALIHAAVKDPATDERVRCWLARLLDDDATAHGHHAADDLSPLPTDRATGGKPGD
jgi:hypothetical protein